MWDSIFSFANLLAIIAWAVLIFLPRTDLLMSVVLYLGVGVLCVLYVFGLGHAISGSASEIDMGSIEGVRQFFLSDVGLTAGWIHYLAFDLFIGIWIARDADQKGVGRVWQVAFLLPTFLAGPVGLLIWLVVREKFRGPRTTESPLQKIKR